MLYSSTSTKSSIQCALKCFDPFVILLLQSKGWFSYTSSIPFSYHLITEGKWMIKCSVDTLIVTVNVSTLSRKKNFYVCDQISEIYVRPSQWVLHGQVAAVDN